MGFDDRKKRSRKFEGTAGDYVREQYADLYRITEQKTFASGRRPDIWLVGKSDHRDRIAVEIKRPDTRVAQEAHFRQLRMYQHQGRADKGLMIYPDNVRVPHELRRSARENNQEIVKLPEDSVFLRGKAIRFGEHLRKKLQNL